MILLEHTLIKDLPTLAQLEHGQVLVLIGRLTLHGFPRLGDITGRLRILADAMYGRTYGETSSPIAPDGLEALAQETLVRLSAAWMAVTRLGEGDGSDEELERSGAVLLEQVLPVIDFSAILHGKQPLPDSRLKVVTDSSICLCCGKDLKIDLVWNANGYEDIRCPKCKASLAVDSTYDEAPTLPGEGQTLRLYLVEA